MTTSIHYTEDGTYEVRVEGEMKASFKPFVPEKFVGFQITMHDDGEVSIYVNGTFAVKIDRYGQPKPTQEMGNTFWRDDKSP